MLKERRGRRAGDGRDDTRDRATDDVAGRRDGVVGRRLALTRFLGVEIRKLHGLNCLPRDSHLFTIGLSLYPRALASTTER